MKNNYFFFVSVPFYIVRQNTEWDRMGVGVGVGGGTPAILRDNLLSHSKAQGSWSDESRQKETENAIQGRTAASANVRCPDVFSCWNSNRPKDFLKKKTQKKLPSL